MIDYLKAYKYFEYASNHFILKGDHRIYHKDVKIEIVNIYVTCKLVKLLITLIIGFYVSIILLIYVSYC